MEARRHLALTAACLVWAALPSVVGVDATVATGLPLLAALLLVALGVLDGAAVREALRPRARDLAVGLAAGAMMVAATWALWIPAQAAWPGLGPLARADAAALLAQDPTRYLPRLLLVVVAEELLWRVSWLAGDARGARLRGVTSLAAYALAQGGLGSPLVVAVALVCGAFWLGLRSWTGRAWAPLIAHAVWSVLVLLYFPVFGRLEP